MRKIATGLVMVSVCIGMMVLATLRPGHAERFGHKRNSPPELGVIRGVVHPLKEATIAAELQATIRRLPFRDGQRFRKGDLLVEFFCEQFHAELAAAKADYEGRQLVFLNSQELAKLNGIGELEKQLSEIEMKKSLGVLQGARVAVQRCRITAPYAGRVVRTMAHEYESVNPYDDVLTILDDRAFDIELIVPSSSIRWLKTTSPFVFRIDENQQAYKAHVVSLGARIDPVSQTLRVVGAFDSPPSDILAGMSGAATFADQPVTEGSVSKLHSRRRSGTRDRTRPGLR